ncbi:MAG: HPP family protein [Gammaproteobacteria bacterium]|jgi:CBS-domain-containing membrane protein|nr:HPP family protein [Gammaproteobacteria bacterium]MBT4463010.1 HPP family protein [Gammaproteobacteria bacterium]MBT4654567.1 HPP family protein [Gammaproteobacteria bacterium]MBT5117105.1 HPP family protein [Gammaproteobacteria bacterium]MBT5761253.1 HPP family protein [Gammaproteobacteria bacterium]
MLSLRSKLFKSFYVSAFAFITIGTLSFLGNMTDIGWFITGSFGATMVIIYAYPEHEFAQPKNIFFGHLVTSLCGLIILQFVDAPTYILLALAVSAGIFFMVLLDIVHPPAGGNPIIIVIGNLSHEFLFYPIISGTLIIIVLSIFLKNIFDKNKYSD